MEREHEPKRVPLTSIHIDLGEHSITFGAEDGPVGKLIFADGGVLFEGKPASLPTPSAGGTEALPEREGLTTVSGRLKNRPREGRPDRSGNPTAYARLAVHEEGRLDAHLYLATFHRHTVQIALRLDRESQITVEGYPHVADQPGRLDTFSVINIVQYPGKPQRQRP